ncbi:biotin--[acetyl-CoA-carboxylase] ligase [Flagellimonas sp. HMM57]|uniref:biotin--[acetyl-CoA-carboxylase] ligase n=1 Tax=unclassified Flagellimonas TaxID=2644544 RepID=UPI0013D44A35|nr:MULTISPECIES: biotin--[acetyl-CoA-carboxylase] ligase [unclassified Flagellimonas]UII76647.1 biotin--[acetyl-CoA-carboxylase] ligase [Flagellimonas sp. HMM57]
MGALTQIIKLDATDSTNLHLKRLSLTTNLGDYTTIVAKKQLKGRGQMGTVWQSDDGKNLTFSVLKKYKSLQVTNQFVLNICVSLSIYDVLHRLSIPDLKVKWPNDIMSGSSKICGILIENILKGLAIKNSIIGVGLNVNQTSFENLDKVASLKSISGKFFDLDELLDNILERFKFYFSELEKKKNAEMISQYERLLFRRDKPSTFKDATDTLFMGFIRGVSTDGKLIVELEDSILKTFGLKEVTLLY